MSAERLPKKDLEVFLHRSPSGLCWLPTNQSGAEFCNLHGHEVARLIPEDTHPDRARLDLIIEKKLSFRDGDGGYGLYDPDGYFWGPGTGRDAIDAALNVKAITKPDRESGLLNAEKWSA